MGLHRMTSCPYGTNGNDYRNTNRASLARSGTIPPFSVTNYSFWQGTNGNDKATDSLPHVTPSSLKGNVGEHGSVRGKGTTCSKCRGFMSKQDEAMVCVSCGKHEYFESLPKANQQLSEGFRPSITRLRYMGQIPKLQNKTLDIQVVDNKYDTAETSVKGRTLSFRYKFPCRYQRCNGDMKQGERRTYRRKAGWKEIRFSCTRSIRHQNTIYENEIGEAKTWE